MEKRREVDHQSLRTHDQHVNCHCLAAAQGGPQQSSPPLATVLSIIPTYLPMNGYVHMTMHEIMQMLPDVTVLYFWQHAYNQANDDRMSSADTEEYMDMPDLVDDIE